MAAHKSRFNNRGNRITNELFLVSYLSLERDKNSREFFHTKVNYPRSYVLYFIFIFCRADDFSFRRGFLSMSIPLVLYFGAGYSATEFFRCSWILSRIELGIKSVSFENRVDSPPDHQLIELAVRTPDTSIYIRTQKLCNWIAIYQYTHN